MGMIGKPSSAIMSDIKYPTFFKMTLEHIFKGLNPNLRACLLSLFLLVFSTVPVSLAFIAINVDSFMFKNGTTEFNIQGRKEARSLADEAEKSVEKTDNKLNNLTRKVEKLEKQRPRDPLVKNVVREFKEFKPTAEKQLEDSERINELVESAFSE